MKICFPEKNSVQSRMNIYFFVGFLQVISYSGPLKTDVVKTCQPTLAGGQVFPFKLHGETGAVVKLTGIRELWEGGKLTDLVLQAKCDGTSDVAPIKIHKVVVATCCPTLEAMFCHDMRKSVKGSIIVQDIAPTALDDLVRFMYTVRHLIS